MSSLHKDFDHALSRIGTYLLGQTCNDKTTNVKSYLYKEKLTLKDNAAHFDLKVKKDVGRFEVMNVIKEPDSYFNEVPKLGDKFGPSYSTQMFKVKFHIPKKWIEADPNCEIHFNWNAGCEASLYNPKTGKHLSAITENVREVYHIKDGKTKNDLADPDLVESADGETITVCYLLEMACQEMFGNWKESTWGGIVDMDKHFEFKKCEIGLFNPKVEEYFYNI